MGDEHGGDPGGALNPANLLPGLQPESGVQIAQRLVQQENLRHFHQSPGNGHPLLLAAGKLAGLALQQALDLHQLRRLQSLFVHLLLGKFVLPLPVFQGEPDVLQHRQMGIQGIVLEHQPHPPVLRRQIRHVVLAEENLPGSRLLQSAEKV